MNDDDDSVNSVDHDCPICMTDITFSPKKMSCGHVFHEKCINEWKSIKNTCPICRNESHHNSCTQKRQFNRQHYGNLEPGFASLDFSFIFRRIFRTRI